MDYFMLQRNIDAPDNAPIKDLPVHD